MKIKKILFGAKEPSPDDPKYKEVREKSHAAGEKFARFTRLDKMFSRLQAYANKRPKVFLGITCAVIIALFILNICRINQVIRSSHTRAIAIEATQQQDSLSASPVSTGQPQPLKTIVKDNIKYKGTNNQ